MNKRNILKKYVAVKKAVMGITMIFLFFAFLSFVLNQMNPL